MTDKEWHRQRGKQMALAYRIWAYCEPRAWDCTIPEVAEALDTTHARIRSRLQHSGWLDRVRRASPQGDTLPYATRYNASVGSVGSDFRMATGERLL